VSSSIPIKRERNDPRNAGNAMNPRNEMNPANNQAHFVRVKMPAKIPHEIGHNMIK
jgi:hypothetical protein